MTETLSVKDLSPFGPLTEEDGRWLSGVQQYVRAGEHVIRFGEAEEDGDFLVTRDSYGQWWAGRYIGELAYQGRRLEISPRLGEPVVERWLGEILNLVAVPDTAARQRSASFIARLMGAVWCRAVDEASRHGPPAIRRRLHHQGIYVRGRLDVPGTIRLRSTGAAGVASLRSARDLDNDVSRALVAAERVLTQRIGHNQWRTPRVQEILPRLHAAVGARPSLPRKRDLDRIRFTPITRPFKAVADLSWRIAQLQGFSASSEAGKAEGLLLDMAELWELFVLHCARRAYSQSKVEHGTHSRERTYLLSSAAQPGLRLGQLKPDVMVSAEGQTVAVLDAKYKRLVDRWPDRPLGVDRADLYQLTSYLSRFAPEGDCVGALLYPTEPEQADPATAERASPWISEVGGSVFFSRVGLTPDDAVRDLQRLLEVDQDGLESAARLLPA